MLRVVIAPDSFKGSAAAAAAAAAIAEGWREVRPDDEVLQIPQADGGEGTLDAVQAAVPGAMRHELEVTGPDGRPVRAGWLMLPDDTAVAEFAQSSGLPQMQTLDALGATSRGLGQVLAAALAAGARSLVIGLGGSATTDGAAGALQALGLSLRDAEGAELEPGGAALAGLASADASSLVPPPAGGVRLLTDVTNPLLGTDGAAAVFGPQKGADPGQVEILDRALGVWAEVLGGDPRLPGAGAAGGAGFGFAAAWGAELVAGSAELARLSGLTAAAAGADVLITGEGRFDATSLGGKVVGHALGLAGAATRVVVIAGRVDSEPVLPDGRGAASVDLTALAGSPEAALGAPLTWLREAGMRAARDL
ncbi:MAG TPA: glycerate kinase [Pseudolysinimonas sp.]|nr:glycerate kinase [Pseudolysinimonas sp.]